MLTQLKDWWRYRKVPHHLKPILDRIIKSECTIVGVWFPSEDAEGIIVGYDPDHLIFAVDGWLRFAPWSEVKTTPQWRLEAMTKLAWWDGCARQSRILGLINLIKLAWGDDDYVIDGAPKSLPGTLYEKTIFTNQDSKYREMNPHLRCVWHLVYYGLQSSTVYFADQITLLPVATEESVSEGH